MDGDVGSGGMTGMRWFRDTKPLYLDIYVGLSSGSIGWCFPCTSASGLNGWTPCPCHHRLCENTHVVLEK